MSTGVVTGATFDLAGSSGIQLGKHDDRNVKNSLRGSCHTLGVKHLPRHLGGILLPGLISF